jgi:hypothetical protein
MSFFSTHYHFNLFRDTDGKIPIYVTPSSAQTLQSLADRDLLKDLWARIDRYGKSFYSTVLADLGQARGPNLLLSNSTDLLQVYSAGFAKFTTKLNAVMGPANVSYADATSRSDLGSLQITPSTLYSQYLCQIPVRKPWSELIVAIIVADLVFLRLLWTVFNILATWWVERRDRTAMFCEGDVMRAGMEGDEGMGVQPAELVHVGTKGLGRKRGDGGYERYRAVDGE